MKENQVIIILKLRRKKGFLLLKICECLKMKQKFNSDLKCRKFFIVVNISQGIMSKLIQLLCEEIFIQFFRQSLTHPLNALKISFKHNSMNR